jgi:hypothetical protein
VKERAERRGEDSRGEHTNRLCCWKVLSTIPVQNALVIIEIQILNSMSEARCKDGIHIFFHDGSEDILFASNML